MQPLLAAGGVSGIALGFGAQKITQNLLSGITMVRSGRAENLLDEGGKTRL